jgi:GTP-binding protein
MEIRNIAIIAHVDHGKTTLTDALMRQTGMADSETTMDSNVLEKEKGITIYSKNTSIFYKETKINIVDTPGHADFGSEVERVLRSIDSVILVVDAQEGPMPQTKFVLKKSLQLGFKPIVVINKIDKSAARPEIVREMIFELFLDLGANDEQLDFPVVYAIAREGVAKINLDDENDDLSPLLDLILEKVPLASEPKKETLPFLLQPFNLGYDNFLGRLAVCRIYQGRIKNNESVFIKKIAGEITKGKLTKLFTFNGLEKREVNEAQTGDIIMLAGLPNIFIGDTICQNESQKALPTIEVDEPTITLDFLVNNSPFAGKEGSFVTNRQLRERLEKEVEINVGLKIDFSSNDFYNVCGRGELHIAILLENMRREGYEIQVSQPKIIMKEKNGEKLEPFEEVTIDVPTEMSGTIIEKVAKRKGRMLDMKTTGKNTRLIFEVPTRGLLGFRGDFTIETKGEGIFCSRVIGFKPFAGKIERKKTGSMISGNTGKALGYALWNLQERGQLYIPANTEVYEGMIIGNTAKGADMTVNPLKGKNLTNIRAAGNDDAIRLVPPIELTLERGLEIMGEDEYLEITPKNIRLRKRALSELDRVRASRKKQ